MAGVPLTPLMKIVLSALQLEERDIMPFSLEELILESWKWFPDDFGLKDHNKEHPCSYSVRRHMEGERGLIALAFIRPSPKFASKWILTAEGREYAHDAAQVHGLRLGRRPQNPAPANGLTPSLNAFLLRLLDQPAASLEAQGLHDETTCKQAYDFYGLDRDDAGKVLEGKFTAFEANLASVELLLVALKGQEIILDNSRSVSVEDLALIRKTDLFLRERYKRVLATMLARREGGPSVKRKR